MSKNLYIKDFMSLKVWQKANSLEQEIGKLVKEFPSHERLDPPLLENFCVELSLL